MSGATITSWAGCYESGWQGVIVPEAFAHPAKMAYGLLNRIVRHGIDQRYWQAGDVIGDPFFGIGTTGIVGAYYGLRVIGVELEPRFVDLAQQNFALHRPRWAVSGDPEPTILQGDSREFARLVGSVAGAVTSPPYDTACLSGGGGIVTRDAQMRKSHGFNAEAGNYGQTPGQIGSLKSGDLNAVITSPPYAEVNTARNSNGVDKQKQYETYKAHGGGASFEGFCASQEKHSGDYGSSDGQISRLKSGSIDAVISSPPYAESVQGDHAERETAAESTAKRRTPGGSLGQSMRHGGYGATTGNIGNLKEGELDAVVTSPPYVDGLGHGGHKPTEIDKAKGLAGQIGGYGSEAGNIGNLKEGVLDGVVSSPPYEATGGKRADGDRAEYESSRGFALSTNFRSGSGYGDTDGQIGTSSGDFYWKAMATVYSQMHMAMKPGAVACIVLKDYVSKKQRVPLCDNTCLLLESLGFIVFERCRCWLVKEDRQPDLWGGESVKTTERKSFFRRLHEAKLPEDDPRRIDYEEAIWCRT